MKQEATPRRDQYSLLSRLMLTSSSDFWTFHAAWFRFVDGAVEAQKKTIHTHMFYELHYVLEGRLSIQLPDDRRFVASAGEFVLLPPRTPHLVADEAPPSRKLVCGFSVQSAQPAGRAGRIVLRRIRHAAPADPGPSHQAQRCGRRRKPHGAAAGAGAGAGDAGNRPSF